MLHYLLIFGLNNLHSVDTWRRATYVLDKYDRYLLTCVPDNRHVLLRLTTRQLPIYEQFLKRVRDIGGVRVKLRYIFPFKTIKGTHP